MKQVLIIPLLLLASTSSAARPALAGGPTTSTRIAAAVNGRIVLFQAGGAGRTVLTHGGRDGSPVMSPDGQLVAFLRTPPAGQPSSSAARGHQVMLAGSNGHGGYRVTVFSQRTAILSPARQAIAWEPGGHAPGLAWFDGDTVQYRRASGNQQTVLQVGPHSPIAPYDSITFNSDDSAIAAPAAPLHAGPNPPRTLRIAVSRFGAGGQRIVTARFRPRILSNGTPYRGSVPVGDGLAYTDSRFPSPGHTIEFATVAKGAGYQITGLFIVSDRGGIARLVLGNGHGLHGIPPFGSALTGATHSQYSPNGAYSATDPNNNLSIGGEVVRPLSIPVPHAGSCVLAQWTWLPDSSGLAYVTVCTVPGSSPIGYRLTLGAVSLSNGKRTVLDTIDSRNPQAIDLAPAYRCVACG